MRVLPFLQARGLSGLLSLLAILFCLGSPVAAADKSAASTVDLGKPMSSAEINELISRLEDKEVRELLIRKLQDDPRGRPKEPAQSRSAMTSFLERMDRGAREIRDSTKTIALGIAAVPSELPDALSRLGDDRRGPGLFGLATLLVGFFLIGLAGEWLFRRATAGLRKRLVDAPSPNWGDRFGRIVLRTLLDGSALVVFSLGSLGLYYATFDPGGVSRVFVSTYVIAYIGVQSVGLVSRAVFSPSSPALRVVALPDDSANRVHGWLMRTASVAAFGWLSCALLAELGLSREVYVLLVAFIGLVLAGMMIDGVWRIRRAGAKYLAGDVRPQEGKPGFRAQLSGFWHVFAIAYIAIVWLVWVVSLLGEGGTLVGEAIGSILILLAVPLIDRLLHFFLAAVFLKKQAAQSALQPDPDDDSDDDFASIATTAKASPDRYVVVIARSARVLIVIGAIAALLVLWGADLSPLVDRSADSVIGAIAFDIGITVFVAYVVWLLINAAMEPYLQKPVDALQAGEEATADDPNARVRTLLPLLRAFLLGALGVMTAMIVLSSMGVAIGPFLAGAGVIGLAIGFGAQALVRDIFSGIFFLIDDAFRVGEYIEMGNIRGEVEKISIRSLRLRHHRGAIHTVPFGEIRSITNYNRDWVIYKMNFRVPFDTDMTLVKQIIKRVGAEMMEDPEMAKRLIQPLKSQGIFSMDDGMIIRTKFMCKPREQFLLRREAYQRIQKAFEENGISFAYRNVTVHVADGRPLQEDSVDTAAIAGAAAPGAPQG